MLDITILLFDITYVVYSDGLRCAPARKTAAAATSEIRMPFPASHGPPSLFFRNYYLSGRLVTLYHACRYLSTGNLYFAENLFTRPGAGHRMRTERLSPYFL